MRLHVVIPFFNERDTLTTTARRVLAAELPEGWSVHVVLIDDHSHDPELAHHVASELASSGAAVSLRRHDRNRGKGAALRTGFDLVLGEAGGDDLVTVQDADLEYDPRDLPRLMGPVLEGAADMAVGNRWAGDRPRGPWRRVHARVNGMLTALSNRCTGLRLHDMECCYKVLGVGLLRRIRPRLTEERFGIEPQLVAAAAACGARIVEAPVSYAPRSAAEGKKIGWIDGLRAVWVILRERRRSGGEP